MPLPGQGACGSQPGIFAVKEASPERAGCPPAVHSTGCRENDGLALLPRAEQGHAAHHIDLYGFKSLRQFLFEIIQVIFKVAKRLAVVCHFHHESRGAAPGNILV